MSRVLVISAGAYGHVTPTLGIVEELVMRGEEVLYFCTNEFKEPIEKTGAIFKEMHSEDIRPRIGNGITRDNVLFDIAIRTFISYDELISDILSQIETITIDYTFFDSMFAVGKMLADIIKVPSISSFAVFATKEELKEGDNFSGMDYMTNHPDIDTYQDTVRKFKENYQINVPQLSELLYNYGDLNIVHTSKYFLPDPTIYDSSFRFIGGPNAIVKKENNFPFDKLKDKTVVYISLGTAFNGMFKGIYQIFFDAFKDEDLVVVLSSYHIDLSEFTIPDNFLVSSYVPQWEVLEQANAAITHGGLNTTSDLVYHNVPFLMLPIGGDQPYMSKCFEDLGATIILDKDNLTPKIVRDSMYKVLKEESYYQNIVKIKNSFNDAGGKKKAVDEIFKFKQQKNQ